MGKKTLPLQLLFSPLYYPLRHLCRYFVYAKHLRPAEHTEPYSQEKEGFHKVMLETSDRKHIEMWHTDIDPTKKTVLFFHPNGFVLSECSPMLNFLKLQGYNVASIDYRGYGNSTGRPYEKGLYKDAEAAITKLKELGVQEKDMVLFGQSLGTGVAVEMAKRHKEIGNVVLSAPYTSIIDVLPRGVRPLGHLLLGKDKFNSKKKMGEIDAQVTIMHCTGDTITPFSHAEALREAVPNPDKCQLLDFGNAFTFSGDRHNHLLQDGVMVSHLVDYVGVGVTPSSQMLTHSEGPSSQVLASSEELAVHQRDTKRGVK